VAACFHAGHLSATERDLFRLFNGLPDDLHSMFDALYQIGALWAVGLITGAALIGHRWRLARDLAIAGVGAWFIARLLGALIAEDRGLGSSLDKVVRFGDSPSFPVVRLAVIAAVISAASPYLTRGTRRVGQSLLLLLAIASLYLGTGFPNDVFAAIVLGWGCAAAVHLAFGSPGGRPTRAQVAAALAELGVHVESLEIVPVARHFGTLMTADGDDGPLAIRVLGRDEADAQFLAKFWRFVFYKDGGRRVHVTRLEDVQEEAYVLLLAGSNGVKVPHVVIAGTAGPGTALLVVRSPKGARLADASPELISDAVLDDLWGNVRRLHRASIAHGALNARHVMVDGDSTLLLDFVDASSGATTDRRNADVAELIVSTADLVGNKRAVAAALSGLGADGVAAALPLFQTAALSRDVRPLGGRAHRDFKQTLADLRTTAATAADVEEPALQPLVRVTKTNLFMAIGALVGVYALLTQIGDPGEFWNTIKTADPWWLAIALLVSFATNLATAVMLMGTVPIPLPFWRTSEQQLSTNFSSLVAPGVGGQVSGVRFLQKQGVGLAAAVAAGAVLAALASDIAGFSLFGVSLVLSPTSIQTTEVPASTIVQVVVVVVVILVIVGALIWYLPKLHKLVVPQLMSAAMTIRDALRSPRRIAEMSIGSIVNTMMYGFVLLACVHAFGASINYWTALGINIFVSLIAGLVPIPGGNTAVGAVGLTGALTAAGVPAEAAVAAVLASQLVNNYIPALPGFFANRDLINHDYL
jgi:undecaprenyl-diphosphatase